MTTEEIKLTPSRRPAPVEPPAPPEMPDDSSSQALSDALRSSFAIIRVLMIGLLLVFLGSGFFTVGPQEKAVILRFGKPVGEADKMLLGPGAHWAFPYPIDEVVKIPVGVMQTVRSSVGWYATTPALEASGKEPPPEPSLNPARDSYLLTGDANVIHVRGNLAYRIREPGLQYAFGFSEASNAVQNAFNSAMVYAVSRYQVDDVLTRDFAGFRELVQRRMGDLIQQQQLGIVVDQIDLQAIPPRQLKDQFNAVAEAEARRGNTLNKAREYESQTINSARANANGRRAMAEADRTRVVQSVAAEAERFTHLLPQYRSNPDLFMRQYRSETIQRVWTNAQEKWILPPGEHRLQLDRQPPKLRTFSPLQQGEDKH
ncbi:MAG TPA: protease modulator HflK [Verrucomicrobiae bacterium]|nr:protease modulator HflK [Verrucomicrobiae bacterium]